MSASMLMTHSSKSRVLSADDAKYRTNKIFCVLRNLASVCVRDIYYFYIEVVKVENFQGLDEAVSVTELYFLFCCLCIET